MLQRLEGVEELHIHAFTTHLTRAHLVKPPFVDVVQHLAYNLVRLQSLRLSFHSQSRLALLDMAFFTCLSQLTCVTTLELDNVYFKFSEFQGMSRCVHDRCRVGLTFGLTANQTLERTASHCLSWLNAWLKSLEENLEHLLLPLYPDVDLSHNTGLRLLTISTYIGSIMRWDAASTTLLLTDGESWPSPVDSIDQLLLEERFRTVRIVTISLEEADRCISHRHLLCVKRELESRMNNAHSRGLFRVIRYDALAEYLRDCASRVLLSSHRCRQCRNPPSGDFGED
ncbi:hypothetical protein A0H81_07358 [Grifola frondosa]|uniref:Uncharacterized protein n=1 Tax=Grifola frondosa TaxID=5627 RepID=A0A1C7M6Z2_GRIFR|nr:hypothetical protein A0H81_07358 [Grifola frondosa]